jgi:sulfotransferase
VKLHFVAGLPRSGSTLFTSILSQNPLIHAEGVSGLCDLMWSASQSVERNQRWNGNPRNAEHIIRDLPNMYYNNTNKPIVVDKCRAWTLPLNVEMLKKYVTPTPKIVCCVRNIAQVERSFLSLFARNGRSDFYESPMFSELQMSMAGVENAFQSGDDAFLFVDYEDLIDHPNETFDRVYSFWGMEYFEHDFANVVSSSNEDDGAYGLIGMHDVRSKVGRRDEAQQ